MNVLTGSVLVLRLWETLKNSDATPQTGVQTVTFSEKRNLFSWHRDTRARWRELLKDTCSLSAVLSHHGR